MVRTNAIETANPVGAETDFTRRRYDRIAPIYDLGEGCLEIAARRWRRELWARVKGARVLELGIGTGRNLPFHPRGRQIVAVDVSERMLERARRRAARLGTEVTLHVADVHELPYPDSSFDTVVASFLWCSVADPLTALREVRRVLVPGGQLLLLEHVLSRRVFLRPAMRWLDPALHRLSGSHIDRDTVAYVRTAGFSIEEEVDLFLDIVKRIESRSPR